jgi:CspA family cold shock protein
VNTGTLKFYNAERGYGFVKNDAGGIDDFVHVEQLKRSGINVELLKDGVTRFAYETETGKNGKNHAVDLQLID